MLFIINNNEIMALVDGTMPEDMETPKKFKKVRKRT